VKWSFEEIGAGMGAAILAFVFVIAWFSPTAVADLLPKLWRTWKGKRT
jgi:hypothetical protein